LPYNGASPSSRKTKDGQIEFANLRAETFWRFREALDPDQEGGSPVALPPDPELLADLTAPTYEVTGRGILVEEKKKIRERIGRSPGRGDAVVMCWSHGNKAIERALRANRPPPRVLLSPGAATQGVGRGHHAGGGDWGKRSFDGSYSIPANRSMSPARRRQMGLDAKGSGGADVIGGWLTEPGTSEEEKT
jgi:hypothetical protein